MSSSFSSWSSSPWIPQEHLLPFAKALAYGCGQLVGVVFGSEGPVQPELVAAFRRGLLSLSHLGTPLRPLSPPAGGGGSAGGGAPKRGLEEGGEEEVEPKRRVVYRS